MGGTAEARELAARLVSLGHEVTTSLAGRTQDPILPQGRLRVGSFGGVPGLTAYLRAASIERLVDSTHPYAEQMSRNASAAAEAIGIPLVRLMRPLWPEPAGAAWLEVQSFTHAAAALLPGSQVLLTTGHSGLETLLARKDCRFVVRLIETPAFAMPENASLLLTRPPYGIADELALMEREGITHLVTKNSGGSQTAAKLEAARQLGVKIIMIARPLYGPATEVGTVEAALAALSLA